MLISQRRLHMTEEKRPTVEEVKAMIGKSDTESMVMDASRVAAYVQAVSDDNPRWKKEVPPAFLTNANMSSPTRPTIRPKKMTSFKTPTTPQQTQPWQTTASRSSTSSPACSPANPSRTISCRKPRPPPTPAPDEDPPPF